MSLPPLFDRRRAARHLRGSGIEVGACHMPIEVNPGVCTVRYVDRLTADEARRRFSELREERIVETDVVCDVARDGLRPFSAESLDFVIASHVAEHLPNPLGFVMEAYRVLRAEGCLYLALPDKEHTFDRNRPRTTLTHLIEHLDAGTTEVDEAHLLDYLVNAAGARIPEDPEERRRIFSHELERSIHVHVWTWEDAVEMLRYLVLERGCRWGIRDLRLPKHGSNEVIFVLVKTADFGKRTDRFQADLEALLERERWVERAASRAALADTLEPEHDLLLERTRDLAIRLAVTENDRDTWRAQAERTDQLLGEIRRSRSWRILEAVRRLRKALPGFG